jgi:hypothetical protein
MNMTVTELTETELLLYKLIGEDDKKIVIQIDKGSHLFIKYYESDSYSHNNIIIMVLSNLKCYKFETIRKMINFINNNQDNYLVHQFGQDLKFKIEEITLNEL